MPCGARTTEQSGGARCEDLHHRSANISQRALDGRGAQ
jgi:hypothetical protein